MELYGFPAYAWEEEMKIVEKPRHGDKADISRCLAHENSDDLSARQ